MKTVLLILFIITLRQFVFAKGDTCIAGVYVSRDDLVNNNLSHKINTGDAGYKLTFPPIADWKLEIKIVTPDNIYKFPAGSVYGYYECGKAYRYSPGGRLYAIEDFYRIEEKGHLIIYTAAFNGGSEHYYSLNFDAPVKRLNIQNLKQDFHGQARFIYKAKKLKRKGVRGGLAMQDDKGNYIINEIYDKTIKE